MSKEIDFETYFSVSNNKFQIFLFDKKNLKNIYKDELKFKSDFNFLDLGNLSKFLDDNIFKIEKLVGKFIKNINLIIDNHEIFNVQICVKKKNYKNFIDQKDLENVLIDIKDLFQENYYKQNIMHMLINNYSIDENKYSSFESVANNEHLCLEINFISFPKNLLIKFDKVMEKYQIKVSHYMSESYIKEFFKDDDLELSVMANKLRNGYNHNEVILIPKNIKNKGFFEKFFQLFS